MALNLFPVLPGLAWSIFKSPNWGTRMQRAVSGRELRSSDRVLPLYNFTLVYEVLRDRWDLREGVGQAYDPSLPLGVGLDELRTLVQFFNGQQGAAIPFAFDDPSDNTTRQDPLLPGFATFATADGLQTDFQLASALGAPVVPNAINSIAPGGSVDPDTGIVSFASPPAAGTSLQADMTYYYRVRFAEDAVEFENFCYQLWSAKQIKLTSVLGR